MQTIDACARVFGPFYNAAISACENAGLADEALGNKCIDSSKKRSWDGTGMMR